MTLLQKGQGRVDDPLVRSPGDASTDVDVTVMMEWHIDDCQ